MIVVEITISFVSAVLERGRLCKEDQWRFGICGHKRTEWKERSMGCGC